MYFIFSSNIFTNYMFKSSHESPKIDDMQISLRFAKVNQVTELGGL